MRGPSAVRLLAVIGLMVGLFAAPPANAQVTTGTIKGEIVDQSDVPVAGVKLTLTSEALLQSQERASDEGGLFRFISLPPGEYRLDVEKEGFKTIVRTNLVLSIGKTVSLRLVLEVPEVGETVEVTGKRPVVDTEQGTQSITFNSEFLENLPTGRSFQDIVQFLPGVTGGANPNINGGTSQSNQYYLDGTRTTDPVTGTFAMNFNFDAIEDIEVITAGFDARYSQGLGGTINIVTKSGGNTFEGDFSGYYQSSQLRQRISRYSPYSAASDFWSAEAYASLGGPIVKDRFWFFASYTIYRAEETTNPRGDVGRDYALYPLVPSKRTFHGLNLKLTAQPAARHKLTLQFRADPAAIENLSADVTTLPEAELLWRQGGFSTILSHAAQLGGWGSLTTTINYQYSTIRVQPMLWKQCDDRETWGYCNDPDKQVPQITGALNGFTHGSGGRYDLDRRHRFTADVDFQASVDRMLGSHTFFAGLTFEPIWTRRAFGYIRNELLVMEPTDHDGDGQTNEVEDASNLADYQPVSRYLINNEGNDNERGFSFRVYAQDRWVPLRGVTIQLGATLTRTALNNNTNQPVISSTSVNFGGSANWDPFRDGKTVLTLAYGRYVDPGLLELSAMLNDNSFNFEQYPWDAEQQKWSEQGTRAATPESSIAHPDLVPMKSDEILVRAQREIARDLAAEVSFLYRRMTNGWEDDDVNIIWNEDGTQAVGFRNGSDGFVQRLRTPQDARRNYYSFNLIVRKQLSDNLELFGSYTFSRLVANTTGASSGDRIGISGDYDNPTQRWFENGVAGGDIPHQLKLLVTYDNPNVWKLAENFSIGYALGGVLTFSSGRPLDRRRWNEYYQGFANYIFKRGTRERLPATSDVDLRASLALAIAGTQVDVIVQAFNLLNSREVTSASALAVGPDDEVIELANNQGPRFAYPLFLQSGRRFEVGLRFHF